MLCPIRVFRTDDEAAALIRFWKKERGNVYGNFDIISHHFSSIHAFLSDVLCIICYVPCAMCHVPCAMCHVRCATQNAPCNWHNMLYYVPMLIGC